MDEKLPTVAGQCVYDDEWEHAVSQHGYGYVYSKAAGILSNSEIYMG